MRTMAPVTTASALSLGCGELSAATTWAPAAPVKAARAVNAMMSLRIMAPPHCIILVVVDSMWSAAVITLEFIS